MPLKKRLLFAKACITQSPQKQRLGTSRDSIFETPLEMGLITMTPCTHTESHHISISTSDIRDAVKNYHDTITEDS